MHRWDSRGSHRESINNTIVVEDISDKKHTTMPLLYLF